MIVRVHGGFLLRRGLWRWLAGWLWEEITLPLVARLARTQGGATEGERGCLIRDLELRQRARFGALWGGAQSRNRPLSNLFRSTHIHTSCLHAMRARTKWREAAAAATAHVDYMEPSPY